MNPHGDAMSKQQVYRDTAPPSKIRDQVSWGDYPGAHAANLVSINRTSALTPKSGDKGMQGEGLSPTNP